MGDNSPDYTDNLVFEPQTDFNDVYQFVTREYKDRACNLTTRSVTVKDKYNASTEYSFFEDGVVSRTCTKGTACLTETLFTKVSYTTMLALLGDLL